MYKYLIILSLILIPLFPASASSLTKRVSGMLLSSVEENGQLWYVNPHNNTRYQMHSTFIAWLQAKQIAIKVPEKTINAIPLSTNKTVKRAPKKYIGLFLYSENKNDELWYVSPKTGKKYFFNLSDDSFNFLKTLALGISKKDLNQIKLNEKGLYSVSKFETADKNIDDNGIKAELKLKALITTTVDCGSESCFSKKFLNCSPSEMLVSGFGVFDYNIIGPDQNGCKVKMKFLENPNKDWENKEMICILDIKKDFLQQVEKNVFLTNNTKCSGELFDLFNKQ